MHGLRRSAAALAGALVLAGCESHTLTRRPDPPLSSADVATIWVAVVLAGLVWTAALLAPLVRGRSPSAYRWVAGTFFVAAGVVVVGGVVMLTASDLRVSEILDGGDCRAIPLEDRPHTIVQLHCDDLTGVGGIVAMAYGVPAALLAFGLALDVLRSRRPWTTTVIAVVVTFGIVWGIAGASPEDDLRGGWIALATAAALATGGVVELRRGGAATRAGP